MRSVFDVLIGALRFAPLAFFLILFVVFCWIEPGFRQLDNLLDIVEQSVPVAIIGIGMTFVLLTAGIDLAVGATMYLGVVVSGLYFTDSPLAVMVAATVATGAGIGLFHAACITRFRVAPFIVTLASMFILRGAGKRLTETKAIIAAESITDLERISLLGIPLAIAVLIAITWITRLFLLRTETGRQIYAVGENREAAEKAGINVRFILYVVYGVCGACAGAGGFLALSQQGAAQNTFGYGVEFQAVAACVLGGTSLFGGRGNVGGAVFGALFVSTISAAMNFANADPYIYPLITATLIFMAAAVDSIRTRLLEERTRRRIIVD